MRQLRSFVADHADADDDTLLIAVTRAGTGGLRGVGFFSMSEEPAAARTARAVDGLVRERPAEGARPAAARH
jgi:hypothetical protein